MVCESVRPAGYSDMPAQLPLKSINTLIHPSPCSPAKGQQKLSIILTTVNPPPLYYSKGGLSIEVLLVEVLLVLFFLLSYHVTKWPGLFYFFISGIGTPFSVDGCFAGTKNILAGTYVMFTK